MALVLARIRVRREQELQQMTAIAEAAQHALLRVMPSSIGSLGFAARYVSATEQALVGGDLYEVAESTEGVRVIVGDVRGKGLEAVQMAATVLAAFRLRCGQGAVPHRGRHRPGRGGDRRRRGRGLRHRPAGGVPRRPQRHPAQLRAPPTPAPRRCPQPRPRRHRVARAAPGTRPGTQPGHVPAGRGSAPAVLHRRPGRESQPRGDLLPPRGQRRSAEHGRTRRRRSMACSAGRRPRRRPRVNDDVALVLVERQTTAG